MIVWLWPYWPVMNVARDGQQSGNDAKLFANVVPWRARRVFTFAITRIDSTVWSSVITTTMFGFAGPGALLPLCAASRAESVSAAVAAARTPQALGLMPAIMTWRRAAPV